MAQTEMPAQPTVRPSPSPTPLPRRLVICLRAEPVDLFLFTSGRSLAPAIQTALYGARFGGSYLNIFSALLDSQINAGQPSANFESATIQPGEPIVDESGSLNVLAPGVRYRPAGCQESGCAREYTGSEPVQMDVWAVRFGLKPGLTWSDGMPLTVDDSIFAYELLQTLRPPAYAGLLDYTSAYVIRDVQVLEWRGLPGYSDTDPAGKFILPLPRHTWGALQPAEIRVVADNASAMATIGMFKVDSWTPGEELVLTPNRHAAQADTLQIDQLVFRWPGTGEAALAALQKGGCDLLDASAVSADQYAALANLRDAQKIRFALEPASLEMLYFNTRPLDPAQPNLLGQAAVRQAVAACAVPSIASQVDGGFALESASLDYFAPHAPVVSFDPAAGAASLEEAGWLDQDQNPATPRTYVGVPGLTTDLPAGTPLSLELLVSDDPGQQTAADFLQQTLAACGIQIQVITQPRQDYLASGPEGPVFGRTFSLALLAWSAPQGRLPCSLFTSAEIPAPYPQGALDWGGANAAGYSNPAFDAACRNASAGIANGAEQVEMLFWQDLPALPLYWHSRIYAARPDLCGMPAQAVVPDFWAYLGDLNLENGCLQP